MTADKNEDDRNVLSALFEAVLEREGECGHQRGFFVIVRNSESTAGHLALSFT